jgi:hypothetical protein
MSQYLTHLAALTLNEVQPLQPRLASRFETPVDQSVSGNDDMSIAQELSVSPHLSMQSPSSVAANSSVAQKVMTESGDGQIKKQPDKQDHFKFVEHGEFVIRHADLLNNEQKPALGQSFTPVDTEPVNRVIHPIIQPVVQSSNTISPKDIPPKQGTHTLVERVREHFTETTHHEFVIKEVTTLPSDARQKTGILKEPPLFAPVKPNSIIVRTDSPRVETKTTEQSGMQQISHQFDMDVTPTPTIQVTIGRIEIRATQVADKPVTRSRAVSNTMSLDDYLKQRGGGKS